MKKVSNSTFTSITTQGGMFPPEFLQRICDLDKTVEGLAAVDYHLPEHRRVSEEANRAWSVLLADWKAFKFKVDGLDESDPSTGITRDQWLLPLFQQLGYGRLKKAGSTEIDGKDYPVSHFWEQSPIHLVGWNLDLDTRSSGVAGAARFAPHGMLQEFLNRSDDHLWGFVSNGRQLRILRDNVSMTRQAYVEFDLVAMMEGECFSDFVLLWLLCHNSRVEVPMDEEGKPRTPEACWLERWSREAETQGARLLDHLRQGVEQAIQTFGSGFLAHPANQVLRERLRSGELDKQDYYRQLLRLVYRLIFLFVAEDRDLLHETAADAHKKKLYFDHYSTQRIRRIAEAKRGSRHRDLWESFKLLFSWLSDEDGCDQLGLSPLGGFLFSEDAVPDLAASKVANVDLLNAVRCLAVTDGDGARRPVDYRNLGAEELGSIYESLLEMHPNLHLEAATFELDVAAGNERKSTGSYYTPKQLVNCLLDSALDPVVEARLKEAARSVRTAGVPPASNVSQASSLPRSVQEAQEEALLNLKVCDPACGSGHFLIGAAHRIAKHLASVRSGDAEPSPEATHHAVRDVITHCIYGVDINPMSVELCKVSLWMEAMEPGKPLGFLDHHIKCGNSLLGTTPALLNKGIPDAAFKPIEGDDKTICAALKKRNKEERKAGFQDLFGNMEAEWSYQHAFEDAVHELENIDDDSIQSLEKKQVAYEEFLESTSYVGGKRLHDAWCAAFACEKVKDSAIITQQLLSEMQIDPNRCPKAQQELIDRLAAQYNFFHWHIEFPDVFQPLESFTQKDSKGWNGGFDCMLGNPPWEEIQFEETAWFSTKNEAIALAKNKADRGRLIAQLADTDPDLYANYLGECRKTAGTKAYIKLSGTCSRGACGKLNTYLLFTEVSANVVTSNGRVGMVIPSGICTDKGASKLFAYLAESKRISGLIDFVNTKKIFSSVRPHQHFCLFTAAGANLKSDAIRVAAFLEDADEVNDNSRFYEFSWDDICQLSPIAKSLPLFSNSGQATLFKIIGDTCPPLGLQDGIGQWNAKYKQGLFNSASDSILFKTMSDLDALGAISNGSEYLLEGDRWVPLFDAKMGQQFNSRAANLTFSGHQSRKVSKETSRVGDLSNPNYVPRSVYWVPEGLCHERIPDWEKDWLLGFKDVTGITSTRLASFSIIPFEGVADSYPLLSAECPPQGYSFLLAWFNSLIVEFNLRQRMQGLHLTWHLLKETPIPQMSILNYPKPWSGAETVASWVSKRACELSVNDYSTISFLEEHEIEHPPFVYDDIRRFEIRCELDAAFFHLSSITTVDAVEFILDSFTSLQRIDKSKHGTYRTKERILEIYQEMTRCTAEGDTYQSALNPPPGPPTDADGNFIPMSEWDPSNWPSHIHRPQEEGDGNAPKEHRVEVKKNSSPDDYFAFSHGIEFFGDRAALTLEAVGKSDAEDIRLAGEERYSDLAKLQTYFLTVELPSIKAQEWVREQVLPEAEGWCNLSFSSGSDAMGALYNSDSEEVEREGEVAFLQLNDKAKKRLGEQFALPPESEPEQIKGLFGHLPSVSDTFVAVYDVGQGLCSAICDASSSAPLVYFDMGCGCYRNAFTRRKRKLGFCYNNEPPIILSHWHADHYKGASLLDKSKAALNKKWLAPSQTIGVDAAKFAALLHQQGNILIWPAGLNSMPLPWGSIQQCTGHTLNTSGLALDVKVGDGTHSVLLPGDAGYDDIPGASAAYDSLVASHHGGHATGTVKSSGKSGGTFALPFGANNKPYQHPLTPTLTQLKHDGWIRQLDTDGGHIALGYPHPGLPTLGCAGSNCDLEIKQC
jgi:hypothetical protein